MTGFELDKLKTTMDTTQKTAHTPGPWKLTPSKNNAGTGTFDVSTDNNGYRTLCDQWERLAEVHTGNCEAGEANARLIAAAPETAAELERVKALLGEVMENPMVMADPVFVKKARLALSRAEGRG